MCITIKNTKNINEDTVLRGGTRKVSIQDGASSQDFDMIKTLS